MDGFSTKVQGKALYNMAILHEAMGEYDRMLKKAERADGILQSRKSESYLDYANAPSVSSPAVLRLLELLHKAALWVHSASFLGQFSSVPTDFQEARPQVFCFDGLSQTCRCDWIYTVPAFSFPQTGFRGSDSRSFALQSVRKRLPDHHSQSGFSNCSTLRTRPFPSQVQSQGRVEASMFLESCSQK